mgnify:CR=1 FL=1
MRIQCLQHVPFENPGEIAHWAARGGHPLVAAHLYRGDALPAHETYDLLVILGGPMNIHQHDQHPWLVAEKRYIRESIERGKGVLGVCLGAQLMADVLGGKVRRNAHPEIGWHAVDLLPGAGASGLLGGWPARFMPFHWHGDTFEIPPGALHAASSRACANQAFVYGERAVGLQFHLEYTADSIRAMLNECDDELKSGPHVQSPEAILAGLGWVAEAHALMERLLGALERSM